MKSHHHSRVVRAALIIALLGLSAIQASEPSANVVIWDTPQTIGGMFNVRDRTGWKAVPVDLFTLEADPAKAFSDPGYYGREFTFTGRPVIENGRFTAVFWPEKGQCVISSKSDPGAGALEFSVMPIKPGPFSGGRCRILRNTGSEAAIELIWDTGTATLAFDRTEIVEIRPGTNTKGIRLQSEIAYGVAPDFIGDDLIIDLDKYPSKDGLSVPAENVFLGLLRGENGLLVMTWPEGRQQLRFGRGKTEMDNQLIECIDFDCDGQSVYLALLEAPGIWHREPLTASFLEKDVTISWKRPFPARWVTQLEEAGVKTRFPFRQNKGQIWRGVPGMYAYPVWFDGDKACYRLSKKVMPRGESLTYFLEGEESPLPVSSPVEILKATLGRQACESILDLPGRRLRTHHRRGAEGIRRACTCGCTEAIEAVFHAGQEVEKAEYIKEAVGDMVYFVKQHLERIDEYRAFAEDLSRFLREQGSKSPALKPYLDNLEQIAERIPQIFEAEKENMKSADYADELARKTTALTARKDAKNLSACLELGKQWRGVGGAQDGVVAQYHMLVRKLFQ
ncbi:MAG TPA: hypothetical protein PLS24_06135, partial [Sedimentisphaerales bacterium]|nr:hypothetical protein [Sedimentisphaerales bacterium]